MVVERFPVDDEPLVDTAPLQPPLAVHAVAPVVDHVRVASPRLAIVVGDAVRVTEGGDGSVTTTCADCDTEPPAPLHVRV